MQDKIRIVIDVTYHFLVRDFLFTPILGKLKKLKEYDFIFIMRKEKDKYDFNAKFKNISNINFISYPSFSKNNKNLLNIIFSFNTIKKVIKNFNTKIIYPILVYRFASVNKLSHHFIRKNKSKNERKNDMLFSEYKFGEKAGFPFPYNKLLFKFFYVLHNSILNIPLKIDLDFIESIKPDLFVFGRVHYKDIAYWLKILKMKKIPIIGYVSSWDHPTTKGPTPKGISNFLVASKKMFEEMNVLHGIEKDRINIIGKIQMDRFNDEKIFKTRIAFFKELGIPLENKLILFGTNTTGLKEHEVSIAQRIVDKIKNRKYGNVTLIIRPHPQDINWQRDFQSLSKPPEVICLKANSFGSVTDKDLIKGEEDQILLTNLLKHSDIVVQSRGSLALDAIAFNKPVISLFFDGDLKRDKRNSFLNEYLFEHYKPIVKARGTWMVSSYEELDKAIIEYLKNPDIHSNGRKIIREEQLEPFDGKASERFVDIMIKFAQKTKKSELSEKYWNYNGLGNVNWSKNNKLELKDYI